MNEQYRTCIDCQIPVLAGKFHEHLKSKAHREKKMASKFECGVYMSELPLGITKEILMSVLQKYGAVRYCSVNPYTGTGSAEFETRQAAEAFLTSPVQVFNKIIRTEPKLESKRTIITSPEVGIDYPAIVSAIEKACYSPYTNIEEQIGIVLDFIILRDPSRDDKIAAIVEDLEQHLSSLLPNCRAELFGSAVTELTLPGDPIDISICDGPHRRSVSLMRRDECAINIHRLLMTLPNKFMPSEEISNFGGPVIKFVHKPTRIVCNLVVNDTESLNSSRKLRWLLRLDDRIRPVVTFIKYWAKCLNLIDDQKFSGYAMTMMVLFFLQQLPEAIIPAIRILHDKNIPEIAHHITNKDPLRALIQGFFGYYAEVRLENIVLAPFMGDTLHREIFFIGGSAIPPQMLLYNTMLHCGARPLQINTPMVLQDPYELNCNLTDRVPPETVTEFQIKCKQAYEMVKTGNLLHLLKAHCSSVPAVSSQCPQEPQIVNTSFKAARFLQPIYLVPEPKNEIVLTEKELFQRWLNVMFVILPDFMANFVRLHLVPQEVPVQQNSWEPPTKLPRISEKPNTSRWNAAGNTGANEGVTKRWLCRGQPVVCNWQQRKKAAAELDLTPAIHPMEREVLISKHLEQSFRSGEVCFYLTLKVDEEKEKINCLFENLDTKQEPFLTVARALVILFPLWINNAFEVGFSLRCVTGVYIPGDMQIGK